MKNLNVCPEDVLGVLLQAADIPDGAKVTKVKGDVEYVLRHNVRVYALPQQGLRPNPNPTELTGYFLMGADGSINQVEPGKVLQWRVRAEEFVDLMRSSWEEQPQ